MAFIALDTYICSSNWTRCLPTRDYLALIKYDHRISSSHFSPKTLTNRKLKMSFVLQLCVCLVLLSLRAAAHGSHSETWREHYRSKRDTTRTWQDTPNFPQCTLPGSPTQYDEKGHRVSERLVTPGQQGACGNCWAFAVAHAFADNVRLNDSNSSVSFSVDHLTKCHKGAIGGNGCCGSDLTSALDFLLSTGVHPEQCLPYSLAKSFKLRYRDNSLTCPSRCSDRSRLGVATRLPGFDCIESESQVMQALQNGPVIAAIRISDAAMMNLFEYRCGIFSITDTDGPLNHAVEIVDYSRSSYSGPAFWVVKNSFGKNWGENGYFRIKRNSNLLDFFFSLRLDAPTTTMAPNPASMTVCGAQDVPAPSKSQLVSSATNYAIEELNTNTSWSLSCSKSSWNFFRSRPTVQLTEIWNATEQVIEGILLVIEANSSLSGCSKPTSAALHMVVMVNMDSSFELIDYSYSPVSARATAFSLLSAAALLMVATATTGWNS